jgi:hypothetical protein
MALRSVTAHWRTAVVAVVIVTATAGGAGARAVYDAQNADKVDGFHAVGSGATAKQKAGKLVAADTNGRLPDSTRLGGYTHDQMATMSIPAQSAHVNSGASMSDRGPDLNGTNSGDITIGFVIPPDHKPGTAVTMRVLYEEDSPDACSWYVYADGLIGPDAPSTTVNIHNGTWRVPGTTDFQGAISVPAGPDNFHRATFTKPAGSLTDPGMFMDFHLTRDPTNAADTCSDVFILGFEVRY